MSPSTRRRTRRRSGGSSRNRSSRRPRRSSASTRSRRRWLTTLFVALALGLFWLAGGFEWLDGLSGDSATAERGASGDVDADRARELLAELTVDEWDSMRGYSRELFRHWSTVDGCNVRQTVLARDGEEVETETDSCQVVSGSWFSPFDEVTLTDPGDIDIDHMVPLANAWRTGASTWDDERRAEFANDLDTPQLIAVSASSNRAKGDQDPSQWQPARAYWCQYAHDWIVVKHAWELSVTADERDALADMLDTCD